MRGEIMSDPFFEETRKIGVEEAQCSFGNRDRGWGGVVVEDVKDIDTWKHGRTKTNNMNWIEEEKENQFGTETDLN